MRDGCSPHTARRFAACVAFLFGALIFQGCGEDESKPYEALDRQFPEGRPGLADVETRTQDKQYMTQLQAAANDFVRLSQAAAKAKSAADHFRGQLVTALKKRMGNRELPAALIEAELAKNDHYNVLLKAQREAEAAVEAKRLENVAAIRARMTAEQKAYDALRAKADAEAKAAGLPTRAEREAEKAKSEAKKQPLPKPSTPAGQA